MKYSKVIVQRANGDYLAGDGETWTWTPVRERAAEFPADELEGLFVDGEVTPENYYANATDAEFLDAGWGTENGEGFAAARPAVCERR